MEMLLNTKNYVCNKCKSHVKLCFQDWNKIERKMVGTFDSHNKAKQEIAGLIQVRDDFWEEFEYEIRKVNSNKEYK